MTLQCTDFFPGDAQPIVTSSVNGPVINYSGPSSELRIYLRTKAEARALAVAAAAAADELPAELELAPVDNVRRILEHRPRRIHGPSGEPELGVDDLEQIAGRLAAIAASPRPHERIGEAIAALDRLELVDECRQTDACLCGECYLRKFGRRPELVDAEAWAWR